MTSDLGLVMGRRRYGKQIWKVAAALGLSLAASAVGAAGASAAWTAPRSISYAGQDAAAAQVAVDHAGDAVIVWSRFDGSNWRIEARTRSAAGVLGPTRKMSVAGGDARWPDVAVDPDGDATIVWNRFDGSRWQIQARGWSSDGTLSTIRPLGTAADVYTGPQVAVDAAGNAVILWHDYINRPDPEESCYCGRVRTRSAGGTLGPIHTFYGGNSSREHVAVDPAGNAVFVFNSEDNLEYQILFDTLSPGGDLAPYAPLSDQQWGSEAKVDPQLAVDPAGNAVFVWRKQDPWTGKYFIQLRTRAASGTVGVIRRLSPLGEQASSPQVAVDPDGNAVLAWQQLDGDHWRIRVRARNSDGTFGATRWPAGPDSTNPRVGVDQNGNAVIVWERSDGSHTRIQVRARDMGGVLGAVQTLSTTGQNATAAQLAVAPLGRALVVWQRSDGTNVRVQFSAGP